MASIPQLNSIPDWRETAGEPEKRPSLGARIVRVVLNALLCLRDMLCWIGYAFCRLFSSSKNETQGVGDLARPFGIKNPMPPCDPKYMPAAIPNAGNTCFIAALITACLGDNESILNDLKIAAENAPLGGKIKQALGEIREYLTTYKEAMHEGQRLVESWMTENLRKPLESLGVLGALEGQHDASEAFNAIMEATASHLPGKKKPILSTYRTYSPPDHAPNATFYDNKTDPKLFDAAKLIKVDSQPIPGVLPLTFGEKGEIRSLPKMLDGFFIKDARKDEPLTCLDQDQNNEKFFPLSERSCLNTAPDSLPLLFNRFVHTQYVRMKINTPIEDISEILDLPDRYFQDGKPAQYRIDGATIHVGTLDGGHYVGLRRKIGQDGIHRYFEVNDQYVTLLSKEQFLERLKYSYMLFYTKVSAPEAEDDAASDCSQTTIESDPEAPPLAMAIEPEIEVVVVVLPVDEVKISPEKKPDSLAIRVLSLVINYLNK